MTKNNHKFMHYCIVNQENDWEPVMCLLCGNVGYLNIATEVVFMDSVNCRGVVKQ